MPVTSVHAAQDKALEYLHNQHNDIFTTIRTSLKLDPDTKKLLDAAFVAFKDAHSDIYSN
jgi:F0F1-type ATP synthase alpha subunit